MHIPAPIGANEPVDVQRGITPTRLRESTPYSTRARPCGLSCGSLHTYMATHVRLGLCRNAQIPDTFQNSQFCHARAATHTVHAPVFSVSSPCEVICNLTIARVSHGRHASNACSHARNVHRHDTGHTWGRVSTASKQRSEHRAASIYAVCYSATQGRI